MCDSRCRSISSRTLPRVRQGRPDRRLIRRGPEHAGTLEVLFLRVLQNRICSPERECTPGSLPQAAPPGPGEHLAHGYDGGA